MTETNKSIIDIPTAEARKKMPVKKQKKPNFSILNSFINLFLYK